MTRAAADAPPRRPVGVNWGGINSTVAISQLRWRAMEDNDKQWQAMLAGLCQGDPATAEEFWRRFGPVLNQVAEKNLDQRWRRRFGPEDVVQSVCRTFFRRARAASSSFP